MMTIADDERLTLEWCNEIRSSKGLAPLTEMPPNELAEDRCRTCPVARAIDMSVYVYGYCADDDIYKEMPDFVTRMVDYYDCELDKR